LWRFKGGVGALAVDNTQDNPDDLLNPNDQSLPAQQRYQDGADVPRQKDIAELLDHVNLDSLALSHTGTEIERTIE
jgi:hypothetical protein